jgi:hypothetical protein
VISTAGGDGAPIMMKGNFVNDTERGESARSGEESSLSVVVVVVETLTSFNIPKFDNFIITSRESRL